ncbi:MAG: ATP-binding protein [Chloroflexi bacterium]|nr:ATP-binding protein [Chloroflexota bacterium]
MQKLPIGVQSFASLRQENYLYVDKTQLIYELSNVAKFVFLARPRRFGKSLLTTTLQEIYRGNKALFQGLWIEDKIDWQPRPVVLINFNDLDYRSRTLESALTNYMDELGALHGIVLTTAHYKDKFRELIVRLSVEQKVVLLIDEYDKPITDLLENDEKVQEHVAALKNFYSVLKSTAAENLHFTLLTGVSKYGKISIFSDLNNLLDITLDRRFATLLGYTQAELEHYFSEHIDRLAETYAMSRPGMLALIAHWYNGYSWDGIHTVYVPFSTLVFLEQQTFANYWFSTATPTFLIQLLRKEEIPAYELERVGGGAALVESADVNHINIHSLLFQTGYLTVKQVRRGVSGQAQFILGYPNFEVAHAFQQYLLADYLDKPVDRLASTILLRMEDALRSQNIEAFIGVLKSVFASIPYTLFLPQEAYYHSLVYLLLKLLGFTIHAEPLTNLGRIDAVLDLPEAVYIIEFKAQSSQENAQTALQQIRDKQYDLPYRNQNKPILLLGIAFDPASRNITDWMIERKP